MTGETAIVKKESRIAPWGDRSEVREIARRVQLMAPGARKLNENEALALAQGAVAHGLDPFNGEIWYIPGSGLMAGIKGLRKAAKNQIEGNYWPEFEEITDPDERKRLMIPDGALAHRCFLRDSETILVYSESWKSLVDNGVPVDLIPNIIGKKPYVEGIGYFEQGEKTKMSPAQVSMKRSEADALKRRFDLPFAIPTEPTDVVIVQGEWSEMTEDEDDDLGTRAEKGNRTLYGEPRLPNQWENQILDKIMDLQLVQARPHAVNILNQSPFVDVPYGDLDMTEAIGYVVFRSRLKEEFPEISSEERMKVANAAWERGDNEDAIAKALELLGETV